MVKTQKIKQGVENEKNEMLIDNLKILDNETLEEQKNRKIVLMIDNLHSKILDCDKETREKK